MNALLLVDIQNDFVPGGALGVKAGDEVVSVANRLMPNFDLVIATQDWHPPKHQSFASQHPGHHAGDIIDLDGLTQVLWPDHCVQGTHGAEFAIGLEIDNVDHVIQKGTDGAIDSYSGFFDNARRKSTELNATLQGKGVDHVYIIGLATDYCVKFTAIDAIDLGYKTTLIREGVRGVNLNAGDSDRAIDEMRAKGVTID